jgi:hypothetical protein
MKKGIDKINDFYKIQPHNYSAVASLNMEQGGDGANNNFSSLNLILVLKKDLESKEGLKVNFIGVRELKINQPNWSVFNISQLEIVDMSESQWENIRYKVIDPEELTIELLCFDFGFEIIKSWPS